MKDNNVYQLPLRSNSLLVNWLRAFWFDFLVAAAASQQTHSRFKPNDAIIRAVVDLNMNLNT